MRFEFARAVLIVLYAIYSFVVVLSVVRLWGQEFFRCSAFTTFVGCSGSISEFVQNKYSLLILVCVCCIHLSFGMQLAGVERVILSTSLCIP